MTTSNCLFGNISTIYMATEQSPTFLATVYHTSIFLLRISQLFVYCKSTKNFSTGNRLYILLLSIEKLYDNFKSPIWKHINYLYGYCAKPNFYSTAHLLFSYCDYPKYLFTANRAVSSTLEIVKVFDYSAQKNSMTNSNRLFGNNSTIYMATAEGPIF